MQDIDLSVFQRAEHIEQKVLPPEVHGHYRTLYVLPNNLRIA